MGSGGQQAISANTIMFTVDVFRCFVEPKIDTVLCKIQACDSIACTQQALSILQDRALTAHAPPMETARRPRGTHLLFETHELVLLPGLVVAAVETNALRLQHLPTAA